MRRRFLPLVLILVPLAVGCAGGGSVLTVPPTTDGATTTSVPTTTTPAPPPPPPTTAPTTLPEATALDDLWGFFAAAEALDASVGEAERLFEASLDRSTVTIDPEVQPVLDGLDATPLRYTIPAGLSSDLEVAVLAVFADLDGRIAALQGAFREIAFFDEPEWGLECLANGEAAADRFSADLERARALAALEPSPGAAPDSVPAGILTARLEAIQSMNWGCEACGGARYDAEMPVDWEGRTVAGVGFEATFDGHRWQVIVLAC